MTYTTDKGDSPTVTVLKNIRYIDTMKNDS